VRTISKERVEELLGRLDANEQRDLDRALKIQLAL